MSNRIFQFARALFRRKQKESELDDEIQFHLEREIENNIKAGMSIKQAKRDMLDESAGRQLSGGRWKFGSVVHHTGACP